jgi:GNAT superfamily N-acetyltransferase
MSGSQPRPDLDAQIAHPRPHRTRGTQSDFHPTEPHWYLPFIGVDVTKQGRGYGSALLRHALERCDRIGLPAYLDATSPLNKPLHERHGFEELGVIQASSSPPMWPMQRKPR